ncbi:unnamed protein product [Closterium sp. Naga37s-1]|nr:unnamed protein product [Closterium sp. Naga37s-1]
MRGRGVDRTGGFPDLPSPPLPFCLPPPPFPLCLPPPPLPFFLPPPPFPLCRPPPPFPLCLPSRPFPLCLPPPPFPLCLPPPPFPLCLPSRPFPLCLPSPPALLCLHPPPFPLCLPPPPFPLCLPPPPFPLCLPPPPSPLCLPPPPFPLCLPSPPFPLCLPSRPFPICLPSPPFPLCLPPPPFPLCLPPPPFPICLPPPPFPLFLPPPPFPLCLPPPPFPLCLPSRPFPLCLPPPPFPLCLPSPSASLPLPSPSASLPLPSPSASLPVLSPSASLPLPSPSASLPVPSPSASLPLPSPSASLPLPSPYASLPLPSPSASLPVPSPSASLPLPSPSASLPLPSPSAALPLPSPSTSLPLPSPSASLPLPSPSASLPLPPPLPPSPSLPPLPPSPSLPPLPPSPSLPPLPPSPSLPPLPPSPSLPPLPPSPSLPPLPPSPSLPPLPPSPPLPPLPPSPSLPPLPPSPSLPPLPPSPSLPPLPPFPSLPPLPPPSSHPPSPPRSPALQEYYLDFFAMDAYHFTLHVPLNVYSFEYYLDFFALDAYHFTLHVPLNVYSFVSATVDLHNTQRVAERSVDALLALCLSLRKRPSIRFQRGSELARRVAHETGVSREGGRKGAHHVRGREAPVRLEAHGRPAAAAPRCLLLSYSLSPLLPSFPSPFTPQRIMYEAEKPLFDFRRTDALPLLLVVDRRDDPVSPLLTQWTYQAMVHEVIGIESNKGDLSHVANVRSQGSSLVEKSTSFPLISSPTLPLPAPPCPPQAMVHELIGIEINKVDLSHVANVSPDQREVVLAAGEDEFFKRHMYDNFGDVGSAVAKLVSDLQSKDRRNKGIQTLEGAAQREVVLAAGEDEFFKRHISEGADQRVRIRGCGSEGADQREVVVAAGEDEFFKRHMYDNFGDVGSAVAKLDSDLQSKDGRNKGIQTLEGADQRVRISGCGSEGADEREVVVAAGEDEFFKRHMYDNFGDVGSAVAKLVSDLQSKDGRNKGIQTLDNMAAVLESYPEYRRQAGNVAKHVAIMTELQCVVGGRKLMAVSEVEQELACTSGQTAAFEAVTSKMASQDIADVDKLRLAVAAKLASQDIADVDKLRLAVAAKLASQDIADVDKLRLAVAAKLASQDIADVDKLRLAVAAKLASQDITDVDKLRLVMLYALRYEEDNPRHLQEHISSHPSSPSRSPPRLPTTHHPPSTTHHQAVAAKLASQDIADVDKLRLAVAAKLASQDIADVDKLRLVMLYALRYEEGSPRHLQALINKLSDVCRNPKYKAGVSGVGEWDEELCVVCSDQRGASRICTTAWIHHTPFDPPIAAIPPSVSYPPIASCARRLVYTLLRQFGSKRRVADLYGSRDLLNMVARNVKRGLTGVENVYTQHQPLIAQIIDAATKGRL